jgi:FAD-linked oxidoreductase
MAEWTNWAGTETATPTRVVTPGTVEEVAAEVRRARQGRGTLKMVGTGHSFTGIAAPEATMLLPHGLTGIVSVDREAMTVTAWAGTPLHVLNNELERLGLSLHNMGDTAEQTLAGAVSTGTHGTGGVAASLSAQLAGLELVTGTGEVVTASRAENHEVFEHARVGLGALGILTTLTFEVEPLFVLQAVERPMSWDEAVDTFEEMAGSHHHLDLYWFPHTDRAVAKLNDRLCVSAAEARPLPRLRGWLEDELLSNTAFGALSALTSRFPAVTPPVARLAARGFSQRRYSDVAHRVFTASRRVVFKEMEYAVPRAAGPEMLREARRRIESAGHLVGFPIEVRVVPADDIPLSTAHARDSVYLAFHVHRNADHTAYFADMEAIARAHDGRPHWGKMHTRTATDLDAVYPRLSGFLALRDRLDPDRVFTNAYLRRVLGD